jgi:hypothetical protein
MKKAALLALSLALLASCFSAAEGGERSWRRGWHRHAVKAHHAQPARRVYSVIRSPRFIPWPQPPYLHCFAFCPTSRVITHMY